jgi:probable F420-dependent oxidoreductase
MSSLFAPSLEVPAFGLFGLNAGALVPAAADMIRFAVLAEELGFESIWMGEHPALPSRGEPGNPFPPEYALSDPLISLAQVAAATSRVRLGTGILVLPLHHPVLLAKQLATIDHLARGRLILGFGMGYISGEAAAFGVQFPTRAARGIEHLEAVQAILSSPDSASYHGRFVEFDAIESFPRAPQYPLEIVAGGHSDLAYRHALTRAQGWYGFGLNPEEVQTAVRRIEKISETIPRSDHLGAMRVTVTPPRGLIGAEVVDHYREVGVHRLSVWPPDGADVEKFVRDQAQVFKLLQA